LLAQAKAADQQETVRTAAAFGTAACLTPGTDPPQPEAVAQLKAQMEVECYLP